MKFYHTPNLTILNSALNKVYNNIVRDFEEAKHFREYEKSKSYLSKTVYFTEKNIIEHLLTLKKDFSYKSTTAGEVKGQDVSNWFVVDTSIGIENIYYKGNHFCTVVAIVRDNTPISVMFYNPVRNETIACEKKIGLMYNNQKIRHDNSNTYNLVTVEQSVLAENNCPNIYTNKLQISNTLEFDIALACSKRILGVVLSKNSYENILKSYCSLLIQETKVPVKQIEDNVVVIGDLKI